MSKLTHVAKLATALGLLVMLLAMSAFTFAPARASTVSTHASTGHPVTSVRINNNMSPLCGTSVWWWSSDSTSVNAGNPITEGVSWQCAGATNSQSWNIDWRDGNVDNYTCYVNCASGSFTKAHTYSRSGTYIAKVYNTYNSAIAAWLTINVH